MSRLDLFLWGAVGVLGIFGPPVFLTIAWFRRFAIEAKKAPRWRRILRDAALVGATLELSAFWMIYFFGPLSHRDDEWAFYRLWDKWTPISFYSCIALVTIACAGKGKGRILTVLSCACMVLGLLGISATR
jgi:hypothetical protein